MSDIDLQAEFAKHFERTDVEGAKAWAQKWAVNQEWDFTMRAMAGHISDYLEGLTGTEPHSYAMSWRCYFQTKYGSEIYWAM